MNGQDAGPAPLVEDPVLQEAVRGVLEEAVSPGPAVVYDGFDVALVGTVEVFAPGGLHLVLPLYDREACVEVLREMAGGGTSEEDYSDARENLEINMSGAYLGPSTPAFGTFYRTPIIEPLP